MSELFLTVLNMSLTASYVIIFVMLIRLLLKRAPKLISYALWGVVAFRLIIPFSFESIFSLMPRNTNTVPIPHDIIYQKSPQINSGIEVVDSFVSQSLPIPAVGASVNPLQIYVEIGLYIWILGIIALLVYSLVSILILKRQLKSVEIIEKNIYEAKNLKTPFVLGLIRPTIYLPVGLSVEEKNYILLHEQTHIHRKDHIIKILAFLISSIHWFNPLVWIAFMLMSTDMELSCDERVLKELNKDVKRPYANSLLSLATKRHILNGSPLAFGEGNVRGRIKNVLNYKKPRFWIVIIAVAIVVAVCVGLLTNPVNNGVIMMNEILYRQSGKRLNDLPPDAYEIGELDSILHNRNGVPERNFQGSSIDEKYAGNLLYQNKTQGNIIYLEDLSGYFIEFVSDQEPASTDKRFNIMTANDGGPIGCEYGTTREVGKLDTLEMLSMLEELQGFEFYEDDVSHLYIEFQFRDENPKEVYLRYITKGEWQTEYPIDSATYKIKVPTKVGKYSFFADITWKDQEKETVFFDITIKANKPTSYDKISAYLKEEFISVFSPYYELIDFIISDYKEEIVNGNVEAVFNYKMIDKNYDRDPDTVEYIKEAKERGDKYYQTYYDEYLQPRENNFYFKAVINKNEEITLYSKNPAIDSEWEEVEISNYMLSSPEEVSEINEYLKKNRNELIENDIADFITYNFENRSMYIVGLEIFNEFGTEEFGYINEGSININSENVLEFYIIYYTGPYIGPGTDIPGPEVRFKMNLDTNEIVEKEFTPAPNYAEAAVLYPEYINPESIKYSEKMPELSDERMVEIGLYFKDYILEIEAR